MTATDELRRMLDERGVEWWQKKRHTCWKVSKGQEVEMWRAWEAPDGSITLKVDYIYHLTPEQAIAATLGNEGVGRSNDGVAELGAGTCHSTSRWTNVFKCSACGFEYDFITDPYQGPRYCPNCGRKVVDDG